MEQALQDPSLAIISDQITTLSELNSVYLKYRVLSSIQKRFSNYYSNEFLGHSVPEMYVLVKDKLKPESDVFEDWQLPNETLMCGTIGEFISDAPWQEMILTPRAFAILLSSQRMTPLPTLRSLLPPINLFKE